MWHDRLRDSNARVMLVTFPISVPFIDIYLSLISAYTRASLESMIEHIIR